MVILKNITRESDSISADYYPEGKDKKGFMKVSLTGSVIEHIDASMMAAAHVRRELKRLSSAEVLPKERRLMWY